MLREDIGPVGEPTDAVAAAGGARGRRVAVLRAAAGQRGPEAHRVGVGGEAGDAVAGGVLPSPV